MDFSFALTNIKMRNKVTRRGWNGKDMFLFLVKDWNYNPISEQGMNYKNGAFIAIRTVDGIVIPWLASQTDLLSDDWEVLHT